MLHIQFLSTYESVDYMDHDALVFVLCNIFMYRPCGQARIGSTKAPIHKKKKSTEQKKGRGKKKKKVYN
jgi:hypothetical protein